MVEMDETPRGQLTFGEALAALHENLNQERRAERAHENACVELRRGYSGWNAPEPTSPHHTLWVRQQAAMDSAKRDGQAAFEARPALVRLAADAARRLAVRADKSPEGLRASAAKLAVELDHCAPGYDGAAVDDALRRLSRDVEALALVADAALPIDGSTTMVGASSQVARMEARPLDLKRERVSEAAEAIEEIPIAHPKEVDFADAMARYSRSCDEMRTMRLNPRKAIPLAQWPEETQPRRGVIVHEKDGKRYVRYVLRVAAENERFAKQARSWWAWWERAQVEPSKAGPAPLVSPPIEEALRLAAARRRAEELGMPAPDLDTLPQPAATASLPSAEFDYTKSSEAAVTAIVRALGQLRTTAPDVMPYKERIKDKAGVTGGAGDRAIECAMRNKLITPDLLVTERGQAFLKDRS